MGHQSSKKINERFVSFSAHDLVSHFEFLKNIFSDKNIQADNDMKNVLKIKIVGVYIDVNANVNLDNAKNLYCY